MLSIANLQRNDCSSLCGRKRPDQSTNITYSSLVIRGLFVYTFLYKGFSGTWRWKQEIRYLATSSGCTAISLLEQYVSIRCNNLNLKVCCWPQSFARVETSIIYFNYEPDVLTPIVILSASVVTKFRSRNEI